MLGSNIYTKAYILIFFIFSLQIAPNDILLALSIFVFLTADTETSVYLYIFSLPWMNVGRFSFGLTISLANTLVLLFKILFYNKILRLRYLELLIGVYLLGVGLAALMIYQTLTGISIFFYFIISVYIHSTYAANTDRCDEFWRKCLLIILISTAIGVLYGFRAQTGLDRWIKGMGNVTQLYGTLGTSRFGLFLALSMLYPLYYAKNKLIKAILIISLVAAILSTISLTSILLLLLVLVYYFFTTVHMNAKSIGVVLLALLFVFIIVLNWDQIGNISFLKPVYSRVNQAITQLKVGDINSATTGRLERTEEYIEVFESSGFFGKAFGSAALSATEIGYSHNSYVDMLNYCGILGVALFLILQIKRITVYMKTSVKKPAILSKLLFFSVAATVSVFSAQYWEIFFFI